MEIEIEVDNIAVNERQVSTNRGSFAVREQSAWATLPGDRYPQKLTLQLAAGARPYAIGRYRVAPTSYSIDRFGKLQLKRHLDLAISED